MKTKTKKESSKVPTEYEEQCLLFKWIRENESNYPALKYANASLSGIRQRFKPNKAIFND